MTTRFQVSDKLDGAIFVVEVVEAEPDVAYGKFASALQSIGTPEAEAILRRLSATFARGADPLAVATGVVQQAMPGTAVVSGPPPWDPGPEPWGNPPVPQFQPAPQPPYQQQTPQPPVQAAPQMPAAAAPTCHHGTKVYISGTSAKNGKFWQAWACPADRNDPSKCEKEWIR